MKPAVFAWVMILVLVWPWATRAAEPADFEYPLHISIPLTTLGLSVWIAGEVFKKDLVPEQGRWTQTNPLDDAVRSALVWNYSHRDDANMASNIVLGSIPLAGLGALLFTDRDGWSAPTSSRTKQVGLGVLIMLESASVAMLANQIVKFVALRERPYTRSGPYPENDPDSRLSFYSGHTTTAFALAVSGATLYDMRGGRYPGVVWGVALALAAGVGYLRIGADKHYFTDVLVGALVGAAAGYLVPKLFHQKDGDEGGTQYTLMAQPAADTWILGITFVM